MKKLAQAAVAVSPGTLLYTVPTGYAADIADITISNTNASDATITLHMVDSGGSVTASNQFIPASTIKANSLVQWTGTQTLGSNGFIQAIGSTTGVNVRITGTEYRLGA